MMNGTNSVERQVYNTTRVEMSWGTKQLIVEARQGRDLDIGDGNGWVHCPIEMLDALIESLQGVDRLAVRVGGGQQRVVVAAENS